MSVGMLLLLWGFTDVLSVCSVVYWLAKCLSLEDWLVTSALIIAVYVSVDGCWNGVFCWLAEYQYVSVDDWLFWSFSVWVQMCGWFRGTLIAWVCVYECGWLVEWCFLLIGCWFTAAGWFTGYLINVINYLIIVLLFSKKIFLISCCFFDWFTSRYFNECVMID